MERKFDVDKIVKYLNRFKDNLPILYNWDAKLERLTELNVLTSKEIEHLNSKTPFEKEIDLKQIICNKLHELKDSNEEQFDELCLWIVKDWGGINGAKDSDTLEKINDFLNSSKPRFNRIASTSKVGSYMYPSDYVIYDSRVAYSLNWIILSEKAGQKFFPIPEGRNSKMSAFDLNVLIRLQNIENYKQCDITEFDNKLFINKKDSECYVSRQEAYTELNTLIKQVSRKLWDSEKSKKLYYTEMLLFSIADKEIVNDIIERTTLKIK